MKQIHLIMISLAAALVCACGPAVDANLEMADGSDGHLEYTNARQTIAVKINSNTSWKAVSDADWLVVETAKGEAGEDVEIQFTLAPNADYAYRDAIITVTAGKATLQIYVTQQPQLLYLINENFDGEDLILEATFTNGWYGDNNAALDVDGDGFGWRRIRDTETGMTYAYSCSYQEDLDRILSPDNWLVSPRVTIPATGFLLRWDAKGYDPDPQYLGDKYEVYIADYDDGQPLQLLSKVCEEVTTSATRLTSHKIELDAYVGRRICLAFHHYESYNLSKVMITNVEISNRR